jgi:hypothetical protein
MSPFSIGYHRVANFVDQVKFDNNTDFENCIDPNLFFDSQLSNDNMCWRLMAQPINSATGLLAENLGPAGAGLLGSHTVELLRGIISENPEAGMSISNNYDNNLGMLNKFKDTVGDLRDLAQKGLDSYTAIKGGIKDLMESSQGTENMIAGGNLLVGTDYIQMFRGTSTSYDIPNISTTIYTGVLYKSVKEKILELIQRFVGEDQMNEKSDGTLSSLTNLVTDANTTGKFIVMQAAPNGYNPRFSNIGNSDSMNGTFELHYGGKIYRNLLVDSFGFKLSAFNPSTGNDPNEPISAEIQIGFKLASVLLKTNMKNFVNGK